MKCAVCDQFSSKFFESENGVRPNFYSNQKYEKKIHFGFELYECSKCNTVFSEHSIDESKMFENYAYLTTPSPQLHEPIEFLKREIQRLKVRSVAEVGGNNGLFFNMLISNSHLKQSDCLLIDRVPVMQNKKINHLNSFLSPNVVREESLSEKFDLVIARHCLAHNKNLLDLTRSIVELTKKGRYVYIENADLEKTLLNKDFSQFYPEHYFAFSKLSVQTLFKRFGLRVVKSVNIDIHNGSFGLLLCKDQSGGDIVFSNNSNKIDNKMHQWVVKGKNSFLKNSKVLSLWGSSAKAVFSFNLFCNGIVDIFDGVFDSTPQKIGKFPQGFTNRVCKEEKIIFSKKHLIVLGAPNFSSEMLSKLPQDVHDQQFIDYNCKTY